MFHVNVSVSAATDVPTILNFDYGTNMSLGLNVENSDNKWYLVVNNAQDYENPIQRYYRFSVQAGGVRHDVELSIINVDDESPYFLLPDSTPCAIRVSNALNKPHSLHITTD
jgi:hypothetical protein